jgi:hypothetical protein
MMAATRAVFRRIESLDITPLAVHIRGEDNVLADMLSRREVLLRNEWRLGTETFRWVCDNSPWGRPLCELFANKLNHHLESYVSPCPDPAAWAIDALVCTWPDTVLYAFPPFSILDKTLTKILQEAPRRLLLIAPVRPLATWFPQLYAMATVVTVIPHSVLSLQQPHFVHEMPHPERLSLALWRIQCSA